MLTLFRPLHDLERFWTDTWPSEPSRFESVRRANDFSPTVDISETEDTYRFEVDLPGVDPSEVKVTLENSVLTVSGERTYAHQDKSERSHRLERTWGAFVRSFELPDAVVADGVSATSKNGVLTVTVPKKQPVRRAIPITTES